jgi:hypothetical protein
MAIVAVPAAARRQAQGAYDRSPYGGMAMLMALTVFAGFGPTYYDLGCGTMRK